MPTIVDHDATVRLLDTTWSAIAELFDGFDGANYLTPTCLPGWTVQDQLSHLTGTEEMLSGIPAPEVEVPDAPHLRNDIARANEVWVQARRSQSGPEVLAAFRAITATRLEALTAMTQDEFDAPSWTPAGPNETYGRFMRIRAYDAFIHEHDVRAAIGAPERVDHLALQSALDETSSALGYIVGRRAQLPAGSQVRICLTGDTPIDYFISVGDRATVVAELDGNPTVGIQLPAMLFLRLTGGRLPAEPLLDHDIVLSGDRQLAAHLATNLAYTI